MEVPGANGGESPASERIEDRVLDLGPLGDAIGKVRAQLQLVGPDVDHPTLYAYLADALVEDERRVVTERIANWQAWNDAYWQVRAEVDGGDASQIASTPKQQAGGSTSSEDKT